MSALEVFLYGKPIPSRLPPLQGIEKKLFDLKQAGELNDTQIARKLGIPIGSMTDRKARIRRKGYEI